MKRRLQRGKRKSLAEEHKLLDAHRVNVDLSGFSDFEVCMKLLKSEFPVNSGAPPIMTMHQLYSLLDSNSVADQSCASLRRASKIRYFSLGDLGSGAEFGVMFTDDYVACINEEINALKRTQHKKQRASQSTSSSTAPVVVVSDKVLLLESFRDEFVYQHWDIRITRARLLDLVYKPLENIFTSLTAVQAVTVLVQCNLLMASDHTSYIIRVPSLGELVVEMVQARKKIAKMVKNTTFHEIKLSALKQKRLNHSFAFTLHWHLRDMIGGNLLVKVPTPSGVLIRLPL